jgi:predicted transcriptional regulator
MKGIRPAGPIEIWRRSLGLTQRQLAEKIEATDAVIVAAESGRPIRPKYVDALIRVSGRKLRKRDFVKPIRRQGKLDNG